MDIIVEDCFFYSHGQRISAVIYRPNISLKAPIIILCNGFACPKELGLPSYANSLTKSGFTVLIFDYRGFGNSEGDRGKFLPSMQVEDIISAVTYASSLSYVDDNNIYLWGLSFGGANAIMACSQDSRIRKLIIQMSFSNGERMIKNRTNGDVEYKKLVQTISKALWREVKNNQYFFLAPEQIISSAESEYFYKDMRDKFPGLDIKIPLTALFYIAQCKPELHIGNIKIPILIISAELDNICPHSESLSLYQKANFPKRIHIVQNFHHYDIYSSKNVADITKITINWLKED